MKKIVLNGYVFDFSVDYPNADVGAVQGFHFNEWKEYKTMFRSIKKIFIRLSSVYKKGNFRSQEFLIWKDL